MKSMTKPRAAITSAALILGLGVSLLAGGPAKAASSVTPVVQVTSIGGFVAPSWQASRLPQLVVNSDGTVLVENPKPKHGYVRSAFQLVLGKSSVANFAKQVTAALQTPVGGWGNPPVADMPNTRVLVTSASKTTDVTISAFNYQGGGLTSVQLKARKKLASLLTSLENAVVKAKRAYKPAKYEIWGLTMIVDNGGVGIANPASVYCQSIGGATNIVDTPDGQAGYCQLPSGENVDEWTNYRAALAALPAWPDGLNVPANNPDNPGMTCTIVASGSVAKQLANTDDQGRWLLPSGQALPVVLRPVLPGEPACHRNW